MLVTLMVLFATVCFGFINGDITCHHTEVIPIKRFFPSQTITIATRNQFSYECITISSKKGIIKIIIGEPFRPYLPDRLVGLTILGVLYDG